MPRTRRRKKRSTEPGWHVRLRQLDEHRVAARVRHALPVFEQRPDDVVQVVLGAEAQRGQRLSGGGLLERGKGRLERGAAVLEHLAADVRRGHQLGVAQLGEPAAQRDALLEGSSRRRPRWAGSGGAGTPDRTVGAHAFTSLLGGTSPRARRATDLVQRAQQLVSLVQGGVLQHGLQQLAQDLTHHRARRGRRGAPARRARPR
jgi:hypothetical protein